MEVAASLDSQGEVGFARSIVRAEELTTRFVSSKQFVLDS
jgi:hypothetical protein